MNFKQLIQDYFTFSRNERKGITILLVLIFLFAIANKIIFYFETPAKIDTVLLDSARHELGLFSDSINRKTTPKKLFPNNRNTIDSNESKLLNVGLSNPELFIFDPNKATDEEFMRLGLSQKLVTTIRNYQGKGGSFRNKDDFFKIYGLSENQKRSLSGFVVIEGDDHYRSGIKSAIQVILFDLNSADSIQLKLLPGIGEKLSKRIVKYRDLLGGFYSVTQLKEVYGLSEQTIQQIENRVTINIEKIRKIDINFADVNELSRHPYLKKNLARQIIKFRTKNGSIHDLAVLRDSMILNIDEYNRLKPYF